MRGLDVSIPFTRHSDLGMRLGRRHVSTLLADGALTQPLRGVYVLGELADDLESRAAAVALALPPGAALCRGTAAWLFAIGDARGPGLVPTPADVECVVATGATPVRRSGLRCYRALLGPEDLVQVQGLWCTTPERTAADLARWAVTADGAGCPGRLCAPAADRPRPGADAARTCHRPPRRCGGPRPAATGGAGHGVLRRVLAAPCVSPMRVSRGRRRRCGFATSTGILCTALTWHSPACGSVWSTTGSKTTGRQPTFRRTTFAAIVCAASSVGR